MADDKQYDRAVEAAAYIRSRVNFETDLAIVLGSGLGDFANEITEQTAIAYSDIPHFKQSAVVGHVGKLVIGKIGGRTIICMQGRIHFYEGHSMQDVVFPVRVFRLLGVQKLVLTNAAGGISNLLVAGDLMIIRDHINNQGVNPLIGVNDDRFGHRFPDMTEVYNRKLQDHVAKHMKALKIGVKRGVYIAFTGPSYESPAEIQMARIFGADAVGMSTVPEAIVGHHMGMDIIGVSCVTNMASGVTQAKLNHEEVVEIANQTKDIFKVLLRNFLPEL